MKKAIRQVSDSGFIIYSPDRRGFLTPPPTAVVCGLRENGEEKNTSKISESSGN